MKKFYKTKQVIASAIIAFGLSISVSMAQAPQKFNYQTVVRNSSGVLISNANIGIKISILQNSATGTVVYAETQSIPTNTNGLATMEIGGGTVVSGNFANIDWNSGNYYIKTQIDPSGGTSYTISGTSQLLSVPYALNAANGNWVKSGNDIINSNSGNVGIGTSTPGQKLSVGNGMNIDNAGLNDGTLGTTAAATGAGLSFGIVSGEGIASKRTNGGNQYGLDLYTQFLKRLSITNGGNVGIGTDAPGENLTVKNPSVACVSSTADDDHFINLYSGSPGDQDAAFVVDDGQAIRFGNWTNLSGRSGWSEKMRIQASGFVGIGTSAPTHTLEIAHPTGGAGQGFKIRNLGSAGHYWSTYVYDGSDQLSLYYMGNGVANVNGASGAWTAISDSRFKKDLEPISSVLPGINKLNVLKYHFKTQNDTDKKSIGMIAQEVRKVFPEVVFETIPEDGTESYLTMDYSAFGVISIKAIQEQQAQIEVLKKQVADLNAAVQKLSKK